MKTDEHKILVRAAFNVVTDQLLTRLRQHGFKVVGTLALENEEDPTGTLRYHVISVDPPRVSSRMASLALLDGVIVPACISVVETHPGEVDLTFVNPTELLAAVNHNMLLLGLASEVTHVLERVVQSFRDDGHALIPDLVTSWS